MEQYNKQKQFNKNLRQELNKIKFPLKEISKFNDYILKFGIKNCFFSISNYAPFQTNLQVKIEICFNDVRINKEIFNTLKSHFPYITNVSKSVKHYSILVYAAPINTSIQLLAKKIKEKYDWFWKYIIEIVNKYKEKEKSCINLEYSTSIFVTFVVILFNSLWSKFFISSELFYVFNLLSFILLSNIYIKYFLLSSNQYTSIYKISLFFTSSCLLVSYNYALSITSQWYIYVTLFILIYCYPIFASIFSTIFGLFVNAIDKSGLFFIKLISFIFIKDKKFYKILYWKLNNKKSITFILSRFILKDLFVWHKILLKNKFLYDIVNILYKNKLIQDPLIRHAAININDLIKTKKNLKQSIRIQDTYDLSLVRKAKNVIIYTTPSWNPIWGGVMSTFSLCKLTREAINKDDTFVCICTLPGLGLTFTKPEHFITEEKVYRFDQIIGNLNECQHLYINITTFFPEFFYSYLSKQDKEYIKRINKVTINILNQRMDILAPFKKIHNLSLLTKDITMTTASIKHTSQELSNQYSMPIKYLSVWLDLSVYSSVSFKDKKKLILYSGDDCKEKGDVIVSLKKNLPGFDFVLIRNLTFQDCMDLTAQSLFTISFGEGFDGYFIHPLAVKSLGVAVYNTTFFPSEDWKDMPNVFLSFEDLKTNLPTLIYNCLETPNLYYEIIDQNVLLKNQIYSKQKVINNLKDYYNRKFDFTPEQNRW